MAAALRALTDVDMVGRTVLVRVDFNVPLAEGRVTDDTRIRAVLPTLQAIREAGGRALLVSHLGRPKGQVRAELSLEPAGSRLAELLDVEVLLADDCVGDSARKIAHELREGQIGMLENVRFHAEEEADDEGFARELAKLADVYVNDAFGVSHRRHASVHALPRLMQQRAAGLLVHKEVSVLETLRGDAKSPYVAVLGGAKVSDKLAVLETLLSRVDELLVGGAMANTFLAAQGLSLGMSLVESDKFALARTILARAKEQNVTLRLPSDLVVAETTDAASGRVTDAKAMGAAEMALDIGPQTVRTFGERIRRARSVFWNGPMGLFERPAFAAGSLGLAEAVAECPGFSVVGGGDSVAVVQQAGLFDRYSHVSTGGGASLEMLEGKKLPGVEVLRA